MPSPFPGMDPYLERPGLWPGVHNWLIVAIAEALSALLPPRYFPAVEQRLYVTVPPEPPDASVPDLTVVDIGAPSEAAAPARAAVAVAAPPESRAQVLPAVVPVPERVRETYLEIREAPGEDVIAVIEILSHGNKRPGEGRRQYLEKRVRTLGTMTHLVEIDLLRAGDPPPIYLRDGRRDGRLPGDYRILVARGDRRPQADLYAFSVRDAIPVFPLPLREHDEEPPVDLQTVLHSVYDRARYGLRIDYRAEPVPPLGAEDVEWTQQLLRARGVLRDA